MKGIEPQTYGLGWQESFPVRLFLFCFAFKE